MHENLCVSGLLRVCLIVEIQYNSEAQMLFSCMRVNKNPLILYSPSCC